MSAIEGVIFAGAAAFVLGVIGVSLYSFLRGKGRCGGDCCGCGGCVRGKRGR